MLATQLGAATVTKVTAPVSAAATANATSAWQDLRGYEGEILVLLNVGVITGTLDFTFSTNDAGSDSGASAVVPLDGALAQVTTSNDDAIYVARFDARSLRGFLKIVGTIGTGPALIAYTIIGRKKYT